MFFKKNIINLDDFHDFAEIDNSLKLLFKELSISLIKIKDVNIVSFNDYIYFSKKFKIKLIDNNQYTYFVIKKIKDDSIVLKIDITNNISRDCLMFWNIKKFKDVKLCIKYLHKWIKYEFYQIKKIII